MGAKVVRKIIQDKDKISLTENQFKTKISFRQNLYNQKKNSLIISYSLSGIIKHALGKRENFNKYFFNFFNFFPLFYHQIFYKKKISALYKVEKSNKILKEISEKTEPDFGKSQHYFNMKVNNVEIKKILYKTCKNIHGISSPFIIKKTTFFLNSYNSIIQLRIIILLNPNWIVHYPQLFLRMHH